MKKFRVFYQVYQPMCGNWVSIEKQEDVSYESEEALRTSPHWAYTKITEIVEL